MQLDVNAGEADFPPLPAPMSDPEGEFAVGLLLPSRAFLANTGRSNLEPMFLPQ